VTELGAIVARNVRVERARRGWRQQDLADVLGWTRGMVAHFESGRRAVAVKHLPQLCKALDMSLTELFRDAEPDDLVSMKIEP
jgi:transcriptional regulator with XRE-family HTH domain